MVQSQSHMQKLRVRHYGLATVVFDGYGGHPSLRDNTHEQRLQNIHPVVHVTEETRFLGAKYNFLSRADNKQGHT